MNRSPTTARALLLASCLGLATAAEVRGGPLEPYDSAGQAEAVELVCTSHPPAIVEMAVEGCVPAGVSIETEIAGTRLWWLRPYLESVAAGNPGVVVRGRIERLRALEGYESIGPWRDASVPAELFYTSSDPDFCATFEGLETILLLREEPCCDVIPPASVACVLRLFEARSLTPRLQALAESPSVEASDSR